MKDAGPLAADLAKVQENWIKNHQKALRENGYWLGRLQTALLQGSDPAAILSYEERVKALTPAQLQAAAQRYFNMDNYVQVVLYPESDVAAGDPAKLGAER